VKDSIYNGTVDMDGIKIEKKFLVKDGVVETMLLNREYAHKFDKDSTGNGWDFSIDYTNIYLEPGSLGFEELIQHMSTGIVVMEAIGPGFHSNNGEVSICIKGLYYENGIFKGTINGTLSGNIIHIMENVTIGNDISFESSLCSPSIQVEPMTFAPVSE
jgi:predicted Zn-dependent protease